MYRILHEFLNKLLNVGKFRWQVL